MIRNDQELAVTRERVAKIEHQLEALRKTARPEEWPALSSGYRLEIERMQGEILTSCKARPSGRPARRPDAASASSSTDKGTHLQDALARLPPAKLVMLGKTFKGMTDKMLAWQTERLLS